MDASTRRQNVWKTPKEAEDHQTGAHLIGANTVTKFLRLILPNQTKTKNKQVCKDWRAWSLLPACFKALARLVYRLPQREVNLWGCCCWSSPDRFQIRSLTVMSSNHRRVISQRSWLPCTHTHPSLLGPEDFSTALKKKKAMIWTNLSSLRVPRGFQVNR